MFNGYGLCGATKDIKLTSEEVEKLKSNLIEWDGEFYPKIFEWKNPEDLYRACVKQQLEIERLNNIIKRLEEFIEKEIELYTVELTEENKNKLSIVAPIKGVYKEIYNVLQELKGSDKE